MKVLAERYGTFESHLQVGRSVAGATMCVLYCVSFGHAVHDKQLDFGGYVMF